MNTTHFHKRLLLVGLVTSVLAQLGVAQSETASPTGVGRSAVVLPLKVGVWNYKDQSGTPSSRVANYASSLKSEIPGRFTVLLSTAPSPAPIGVTKAERLTFQMGSKQIKGIVCSIYLTGSKSRKVFNASWKVEDVNFTATAFLKEEAGNTAKQKGVEFVKQLIKNLVVKTPSSSRK